MILSSKIFKLRNCEILVYIHFSAAGENETIWCLLLLAHFKNCRKFYDFMLYFCTADWASKSSGH